MKHEIKRKMLLQYFKWKFKEYDMNETIYITGSPRSGTTWLAEILTASEENGLLFEPMRRIRRNDENKRIKLSFRPFIEPDSSWPEMELLLSHLFSGKRPEFFRWSSNNKLKQLLKGRKWVVKFVIMNRLLPWMIKNFPTQLPILILRHPCSSIASKIRWSDPVKKIEDDDRNYISEKIPSLKGFLEKLNTSEEFIALSWCIDAIVPLSSQYTDSFIILTYERLVTDGEKELERIYKKLQLNVSEYAIQKLGVPSKTIGYWSVNHSNATIKERLSRWKHDLSSEQIKRIMGVLNAFGIKFYSEDLEPDYDLIYNKKSKILI